METRRQCCCYNPGDREQSKGNIKLEIKLDSNITKLCLSCLRLPLNHKQMIYVNFTNKSAKRIVKFPLNVREVTFCY